jgi:esterase/lipase
MISLYILFNSLATLSCPPNLEFEKGQFGEQVPGWFHTPNQKIRGVAFLLHGLNAKPSVMDDLAKFLNGKGVDVLRGSLRGHLGNAMEKEDISREIWLQETYEYYCSAKKKSRELGVPLFFIGYSLGALIFNDLLVNTKGITVDKMVLFSPAFKIRWHLRLFSFIFKLGDFLKLPSANLPEYRSSNYTSFGAYRALWESYNSLDFEKLDPPQALIIMDPKDELVSYSKTEDLVKKYPSWKLLPVDTSGSRNSRKYGHITFNEKSFGEGKWGDISKEMEKFLFQNP